jgi:hypothetical protein
MQMEEAEEVRTAIENVLLHTLSINDAIDWGRLKDTSHFSIPEPTKPPHPMMPLKTGT